MEKKIKQTILEELDGMKETRYDDAYINQLDQIIHSLNQSIATLNETKKQVLNHIFDEAKEKLGNKYDLEDDENEGIIWTTLEHNGIPFNLEAHLCFKEADKPYLGFIHVSSHKDHLTDEWLKSLFPGEEWRREFDNNKWYCWKYTSYERVIGEFEEVMGRMQ